MSDAKNVGDIEWRDLTVDEAEYVSDFYQQVVGWQRSPVSMGDYDDYSMNSPINGDAVAGVCHAQGVNDGIPSQWMMYVRVADVAQSVESVTGLGGEVLKGPTTFSGDTYYVIKDPAGAVLTIFSS